MTAISVVIPLYNTKKYLERFIASLQSQTFKDFEAIFVDDASTDGGPALVEGFISGDPRIKLIRSPRNMGAGAARNAGIRAASGETLCFADPDDLLPETSLEKRYKAFKEHRAIVRACHDEIGHDGTLLNHETRPEGLPLVFKPSDVYQSFGTNPFLCAHWTWLFPTKMLQRLQIFNEENMRTAEDITLLVHLYFNTSRLVWIPDTVYFWIKRANSLSNTFYTAEHYFDYLMCVDLFYEEAIKSKKVAIADSFCNDYLDCYISHVLYQISRGQSTEADAQAVIREAARICGRHDVFGRRLAAVKSNPLENRGLFKLWRALADDAPLMTQRLVNAHNALAPDTPQGA